jgi:hypothetical protein
MGWRCGEVRGVRGRGLFLLRPSPPPPPWALFLEPQPARHQPVALLRLSAQHRRTRSMHVHNLAATPRRPQRACVPACSCLRPPVLPAATHRAAACVYCLPALLLLLVGSQMCALHRGCCRPPMGPPNACGACRCCHRPRRSAYAACRRRCLPLMGSWCAFAACRCCCRPPWGRSMRGLPAGVPAAPHAATACMRCMPL